MRRIASSLVSTAALTFVVAACGNAQFANSSNKKSALSKRPAADAGAAKTSAGVRPDERDAGGRNADSTVTPTPLPTQQPSPSAEPIEAAPPADRDATASVLSGTPSSTPLPSASPSPTAIASVSPSPLPETAMPPPPVVRACSAFLQVPAKSNPWLAGAPDGTRFRYARGGDDVAPVQSPVLHESTCVTPGKSLTFDTDSTASHTGSEEGHKGEGKEGIASFELGAQHGFSDVAAPFDSLVAVFLPATQDASSAAPAKLDFSDAAKRDFSELRPKLGQVFFIGDGKTSSGDVQRFVVPQGAARIAFGNMDSYEWVNNAGAHEVKVNEVVP